MVLLKSSIRLSIYSPTFGKSKRFVFVESGILHGVWNQEFRLKIESGIQIPLTSKAGYSTWNLESLLGIQNLRLSWIIDPVTVFDTVLTSRQTSEKLQCL